MEKNREPAGSRIVLLMGGVLLAGALVAFLSILLAVTVSAGLGPGATGERMLVVIALLAVFLLGELPVTFILVMRWTGRTGAAFGLTLLAAFWNGLVWVATFFAMAVVLNR